MKKAYEGAVRAGSPRRIPGQSTFPSFTLMFLFCPHQAVWASDKSLLLRQEALDIRPVCVPSFLGDKQLESSAVDTIKGSYLMNKDTKKREE